MRHVEWGVRHGVLEMDHGSWGVATGREAWRKVQQGRASRSGCSVRVKAGAGRGGSKMRSGAWAVGE